MERDMDLIRKMLIAIEQHPKYDPIPLEPFEFVGFGEYTENKIDYHLNLLYQAGFTNTKTTGQTFSHRFISGLTWNGHEFLDLMKDDTAWNRAKETMKKTGGMAFEVLLKVLAQIATTVAMNQL